jgi:sugar lactone lactonase YvrE
VDGALPRQPGGAFLARWRACRDHRDARDITKMAFGGAGFSTGYVTTATKNMSPEDMALYPQAGSLLAFIAPVPGFEQTRARLG